MEMFHINNVFNAPMKNYAYKTRKQHFESWLHELVQEGKKKKEKDQLGFPRITKGVIWISETEKVKRDQYLAGERSNGGGEK